MCEAHEHLATTYLVERYLPGVNSMQLAAAITAVETSTARMRMTGTAIRYLGSMFVPTDEACFCLFAARSEQAVREANELAAFPMARAVPAVLCPPERSLAAVIRERGAPC
jgi:hypothetical protein